MRYAFEGMGQHQSRDARRCGFADMETASGTGAMDGISAGVNRLRVGLEASVDMDPGNGGSVTPFGEVAVRNDGGGRRNGFRSGARRRYPILIGWHSAWKLAVASRPRTRLKTSASRDSVWWQPSSPPGMDRDCRCPSNLAGATHPNPTD